MLVIPMKEKKKGGVEYGRSYYCTIKDAKPRLDGLAWASENIESVREAVGRLGDVSVHCHSFVV
jgi:hypothetical protein